MIVSVDLFKRDHEFDPQNEKDASEAFYMINGLYQRHGVKWVADALVAYIDFDCVGCTCEPDGSGPECVRCYIRDRLNMDVLEDE